MAQKRPIRTKKYAHAYINNVRARIIGKPLFRAGYCFLAAFEKGALIN